MVEKVTGLKASINRCINGILKEIISLLALFPVTQLATEIFFRVLLRIDSLNPVVDYNLSVTDYSFLKLFENDK